MSSEPVSTYFASINGAMAAEILSARPDAFHACLGKLFHLPPPTALLVDEAAFFVATLDFCAHRRIRAPAEFVPGATVGAVKTTKTPPTLRLESIRN